MFTTVIRLLKRRSPSKNGRRLLGRYSTETSKETYKQTEEDRQNGTSVRYGQPTPMTHPHLLAKGELLPGIRLEEFQKRRSRLMDAILSCRNIRNPDKPQIVIVPSATKVYMTDKIPYVFRQNTDFLYFTGCQEPDSVLVITAKDENFVSTIFVRPKDEHAELWDGPRTGVEVAREMFGTDHALPVTEFHRFLGSFAKEHKNYVLWYDDTNVVQPELHSRLRQLTKSMDGQTVVSPINEIHRIRSIKSKCEIDLMRKSCEIASAAITKTIQNSKPRMSEHQLFAIVDYECRMRGAEFLAYPPVVAAGQNANVIHYITNNQIIQNGDIVLMDAGCEYHGYTSDITRTWPINGTFTQEQRILYEVVLDVQSALIQKLKEMPSLDQLFQDMCHLLGKRLQEIGLIPNDLRGDKLLTAAFAYCPHHVSHYLGMDVHDTPKISRAVKTQPGMVVTVEPGIYVSSKNRFAPQKFHGLGIRIEDDVLLTEHGPEVLTGHCPKGIEEIEELASRNQ